MNTEEYAKQQMKKEGALSILVFSVIVAAVTWLMLGDGGIEDVIKFATLVVVSSRINAWVSLVWGTAYEVTLLGVSSLILGLVAWRMDAPEATLLMIGIGVIALAMQFVYWVQTRKGRIKNTL